MFSVDLADQARSQQRVSAHIEKIVIQAHRADLQDLAHGPSDRVLDLAEGIFRGVGRKRLRLEECGFLEGGGQ